MKHYSLAAEWLKGHELNKNGQYLVDENGNAVRAWQGKQVVAGCIIGACYAVGVSPEWDLIREKIGELYPVKMRAAGNSLTTWNDNYATKREVIRVLESLDAT